MFFAHLFRALRLHEFLIDLLLISGTADHGKNDFNVILSAKKQEIAGSEIS